MNKGKELKRKKDQVNCRVLRCPKVLEKIGVSKPTLYRMVKTKRFPKPVQISERLVGWIESDVDNWLLSRRQQS